MGQAIPIITTLATAASGTAAVKQMTTKPKLPDIAPPQITQATNIMETAQAEADKEMKKKVALKKMRGGTLLTSPTGVSGGAPIIKKTLLGE